MVVSIHKVLLAAAVRALSLAVVDSPEACAVRVRKMRLQALVGWQPQAPAPQHQKHQ